MSEAEHRVMVQMRIGRALTVKQIASYAYLSEDRVRRVLWSLVKRGVAHYPSPNIGGRGYLWRLAGVHMDGPDA